MTEHDPATSSMRTVRFHEYGAPGDVLHLETVAELNGGPADLVLDTASIAGSWPEALPEFGQLAADGVFTVPIAASFSLDEWKTALEISQTGNARELSIDSTL